MFETTNQGALYAGLVMEVPHWMFFWMENPNLKWMVWGYPHFRTPPYSLFRECWKLWETMEN